MTKQTTWLDRAKENLFKRSNEKQDFALACEEWVYTGLEDMADDDFDCELCGHPNIRYEYTIQNTHNQNQLIVGSECIKKFVDTHTVHNIVLHDANGFIVDKKRVENDKKDYWRNKIIQAIESINLYNEGLKQSIITSIQNKKAITIKQANSLKAFYFKLPKDDKRMFKKIIKLDLKKPYFKAQYFLINNPKCKEYVDDLLTGAQKKRLDKITDFERNEMLSNLTPNQRRLIF